MKFKQSKPVIHRTKLDAELYYLRKELERLMLLQAVVDSYSSNQNQSNKQN